MEEHRGLLGGHQFSVGRYRTSTSCLGVLELLVEPSLVASRRIDYLCYFELRCKLLTRRVKMIRFALLTPNGKLGVVTSFASPGRGVMRSSRLDNGQVYELNTKYP
jgi:hypothetical protein